MSSGKGGGKKASRARSGKKGLAHPKPPKRKTPAPKKAAAPRKSPVKKAAPKKKTASKRGRTRLDLGGGNGLSALSRIARTVSKAAAGRGGGGDEGN